MSISMPDGISYYTTNVTVPTIVGYYAEWKSADKLHISVPRLAFARTDDNVKAKILEVADGEVERRHRGTYEVSMMSTFHDHAKDCVVYVISLKPAAKPVAVSTKPRERLSDYAETD